jgi:PAS domain S-box-containing protein
VREPLVTLDAQLHIESANYSFYRTFDVSPEATVGKFIYDLGNRQWNIPGLRILLEELLPLHKTIENFEVEHDFEHIGHRTMLLNARRIRDLTWKTHRILLAIEDITERKQLHQQVQSAHLAEVVLATAPGPLLILNADLRVHSANEAFYKTFRESPAESVSRSISELGNGQWSIPKLRELLEGVLPRNSFFNDFEVTHDFERIGRRTMLLNGRKLTGDGSPERILVGIQDITEMLPFQVVTRENAEKFKVLFEATPLPMLAFDLETLRFIYVNRAAVEQYCYSREEFLCMSILDICMPEAGQAFEAMLAHLPERFFSQHRKKNGEVVDVEVAGSEIRLAGKRVWLASINGITERKAAGA